MGRRNLKIFRVRRGLTQEEIAREIGVCRSTYAEIETGKRECNTRFLKKLQNVYEIPDAEMWALTKNHSERTC